MKIKNIKAYEIIDSRGTPTIECHLQLDNLTIVQASVPSGASVGSNEAYELRDRDQKRFHGMGVLKAIDHIVTIIAPALIGKEPNVPIIDQLMRDLDGTKNKSKLGANAILAVSMATARAQAHAQNQELYELFSSLNNTKPILPHCMFNILNGGIHGHNGLTIQEFMIMPLHESVTESVRIATEIYHTLKELLLKQNYSITVGDEGGFAPRVTGEGLEKEIQALDLLMQAIEQAGYRPGTDVQICIDAAASQFYNQETKQYHIDNLTMSSGELITFYQTIGKNYPIFMLEDGLSEFDRNGWQELTKKLGNNVCLVGDDIFVTNSTTIQAGICDHIANGALIKPNQIGTVSETLIALQTAKTNNYATVVSHRSGETNDTFIADLAIGTAAGYIKAGACARGERVAKYNRLMAIERMLSS